MRIQILGSAAGGRFPQWNCGCGNCAAVRKNERENKFSGKARTQSQLALSADGSTWFLAGASPDLAFQIESFPQLHPRALRDSPVAGVVLGSCDLDHSGALFPLLSADGKDSGLRCEVCYLSGRYPKYVKTETKNLACDEATAALFFQSSSGKRVAYVPAAGSLSDALLEKIHHADLLLFDGTFWSDDELLRVQGSGETARQMGHIPIEESLRTLKNIKVGRKMFIHLNNTNPILNETSPEHRAVRQSGWEVAEDNWQLEL